MRPAVGIRIPTCIIISKIWNIGNTSAGGDVKHQKLSFIAGENTK